MFFHKKYIKDGHGKGALWLTLSLFGQHMKAKTQLSVDMQKPLFLKNRSLNIVCEHDVIRCLTKHLFYVSYETKVSRLHPSVAVCTFIITNTFKNCLGTLEQCCSLTLVQWFQVVVWMDAPPPNLSGGSSIHRSSIRAPFHELLKHIKTMLTGMR